MKLFIFRHAQKSYSPPEDPDLTDQGHQQAEHLVDMVRKGQLPQPTALFVSPKIRAQSTFEPLSKSFKIQIEINLQLSERHSGENQNQFQNRVRTFLDSCVDQFQVSSVVFICSHHDWIHEALHIINADKNLLEEDYAFWPPTQYIGFEIPDPKHCWQMISFRQPHFSS